ncbi:hypothetical protein LOK49_LG02G00117 [Camellia lanceoleosa]|uniref:Uncharacterized protein n=1 Tax=Camellia lanceoleosa TaxID=1840588 RepID=A0ACC0IGA0_9ERIC|nr:hypothetical protein LOK49_LG02G00117 [Camellia lanceoleosa]
MWVSALSPTRFAKLQSQNVPLPGRVRRRIVHRRRIIHRNAHVSRDKSEERRSWLRSRQRGFVRRRGRFIGFRPGKVIVSESDRSAIRPKILLLLGRPVRFVSTVFNLVRRIGGFSNRRLHSLTHKPENRHFLLRRSHRNQRRRILGQGHHGGAIQARRCRQRRRHH